MSNSSEKPLLALTMGDPSGVGPEVIAGIWNDPIVHEVCRPVVLGDPGIMQRAIELKQTAASVEVIGEFEAGADKTSSECMPCLSCTEIDLSSMEPGIVTRETGLAAYDAIIVATELAKSGRADGLVTAPINKTGLRAAGKDYPGHTELLAELCGVSEFAMMLYLPQRYLPKTNNGLGVVHVTLHTSVRDAVNSITIEAILEKCRLADQAARAYGAASPKVGVAALNPHGGEGGLFGNEEIRLIEPAVVQAQAKGVHAIGPLPADTLMVRASQGEFDIVVAMLHDQGHIALKLLGMHSAVNVTLGLPIVRTSVAHGTAGDLAWRGIAETSGMVSAIEAAASLSQRRKDQLAQALG